MHPSSSKKINSFVKPHQRELGPVFTKIRELEAANRALNAHLEPGMAQFCQVANLIAGKLVLLVANGSIATQIRFQMTDIVKKLRKDPALASIQSIECKVRPPATVITSDRYDPLPPRYMAALSQETSEAVLEIARSLEDPELRRIMERIAERRAKSLGPR